MSKIIEINCKQCQTPFVYATKRGQPPKFCSDDCKKTWEKSYNSFAQKQGRLKKKKQKERAKKQVESVKKYEQQRQAHHLHLKFYNDDETERQLIAFFKQQKANKNLKNLIKELVLAHLTNQNGELGDE